jgi:hypothetical protein
VQVVAEYRTTDRLLGAQRPWIMAEHRRVPPAGRPTDICRFFGNQPWEGASLNCAQACMLSTEKLCRTGSLAATIGSGQSGDAPPSVRSWRRDPTGAWRHRRRRQSRSIHTIDLYQPRTFNQQ